MPEKYDVAIVGGGICGLSTALALKGSTDDKRADGLRVALFNEGKLGGSSATIQNGGTIHTGASYVLTRTRESQHEAAHCRRTADIAGSILPPECIISRWSNYLVGQEHIDNYRRTLDDLNIRHKPLSSQDLANVLRPDRLRETDGVVVEELQVDMGEAMLRFTQACLDAGVEIIIDRPISRMTYDNHNRATGLLTEDGAFIAARYVVVCAGNGAIDLLRRSALATDWLLRRFHRHRSLHIVVPGGDIGPIRGAQIGFPVVTQLRQGKSIGLYGVPPKDDPEATLDHLRHVFRSWFLPGRLELDDAIAVTEVNKVEFHPQRLARSTLPRTLDGHDLRIDGAFCLVPGKISHAVSLALGVPRLLGIDAAPVQALSDRLNCRVDRWTREIIQNVHGERLSAIKAVEPVE